MKEEIKIKTEKRPWGFFVNLITGRNYHVKLLSVDEGERLSLQRHKYRDELWILLEGIGFIHKQKKGEMVRERIRPWSLNNFIRRLSLHRLEGGKGGAKVLEVSFGFFDEQDIERFEDDYERGV